MDTPQPLLISTYTKQFLNSTQKAGIQSSDKTSFSFFFFLLTPYLNDVKLEQISSLYSRFYFEFKFTLRSFPNALLLVINVLKDAPYALPFVSYVSFQ